MVLIGFVLVAAAAAFGIDLVAQNRVSIDVEVFGQLYATTPAAMFVAGVVTGLTGALGVMLLRDGMARRRRLRIEAKAADEARERHIAALEEEHAAHHRELVGAHDGDIVDVRDRDHATTF